MQKTSPFDSPILQHRFAHYYENAHVDRDNGLYERAFDKLMTLNREVSKITKEPTTRSLSFRSVEEFFAAIVKTRRENDHETIVWIDLPVANLYYDIGVLLVDMKRYDEALGYFRQSIKWNPMNPNPHYETAFIRQWMYQDHRGAFDEAKKGLEKSYLVKERALGYRHLGAALIDLKDLEGAEACYCYALHLEPENSNAKEQLQYIYTLDPSRERMLDEVQCEKNLESRKIPVKLHENFIEGMLLYARSLEERGEASKAQEFYKVMAMNGHAGAAYALAVNIGILQKNLDEGLYWALKALFNGEKKGKALAFELMQKSESKGPLEMTVRLLADQCLRGDAEGCFMSAMYYQTVESNCQKYVSALEKAVDLGYLDAYFMLGTAYYGEVECVEKDPQKAIRLWEYAAKKGEPLSQYNIGMVFYEGNYRPKNFDNAVYWLKKAADQGVEEAERELAQIEKEQDDA